MDLGGPECSEDADASCMACVDDEIGNGSKDGRRGFAHRIQLVNYLYWPSEVPLAILRFRSVWI
jgi:hypothetical protein